MWTGVRIVGRQKGAERALTSASCPMSARARPEITGPMGCTVGWGASVHVPVAVPWPTPVRPAHVGPLRLAGRLGDRLQQQPFSRWREVFGDEVVAAAIIDPLVHHAEVIDRRRKGPRPRPRRTPTTTGD